MRRVRVRRLLRSVGMVSAIAASSVAAGCAARPSGDGASANRAVAAAARTTIDESTARTEIQVDADGILGSESSLEIDGVVDFDAHRSDMTIDMGRFLPGADGTMQLRTIGNVAYLRTAALDELAAPDEAGKWIKFDFDAMAGSRGVTLPTQFGDHDPRQGLAMLQGVAAGDVRDLGPARIDGVDTTHYRATVDVRRAVARAGTVTDEQAFRRFADQLGARTVRVDAWIDGEGRVRKLRIPMAMSHKLGGGTVTVTTSFLDFGVTADIAEPPSDQVLDAGGLSGGVTG